MAAPTKGSCRLRSSRALGAAFEAHQRHALSLGERFQPEVRFSRLTCRAADRPAPPSLTIPDIEGCRQLAFASLQNGRSRTQPLTVTHLRLPAANTAAASSTEGARTSGTKSEGRRELSM